LNLSPYILLSGLLPSRYKRGLKPRDYILDSEIRAGTRKAKTLSSLRLGGKFSSVAASPRCVTGRQTLQMNLKVEQIAPRGHTGRFLNGMDVPADLPAV